LPSLAYGIISAARVEVPEVEAVVFRLPDCGPLEVRSADLELQNADDMAGQENRVDSTLSTRDRIFQEKHPSSATRFVAGQIFDDVTEEL
jgi:hypothetical protein